LKEEIFSMRMNRLCSPALGLIFLACCFPAGLAAQASTSDVNQKIADLEKQLNAVRAELEALKPTPTVPPTTRDAAPPTQEKAAVAPTPAPNPMAGINSVLGGVTLTGLADVYYGYNANHPVNGTATEPFLSTNDQFSLNLIELQLDKVPDKTAPLGFRIAFGFGQAMNAVNSTDPGGLAFAQYLKEGYLSYMAPLGKGLQVDVGKFVTPMGAEVIETNQNWNYSRSLLFNYAIPYYHFGARAKYAFNDKWTVTGFAVNGWNNIIENNSGKTGGVSIGWNATKKITITESYLAGPETVATHNSWRNMTDTVIAYNPTAKLSLQANVDYGRQQKLLAAGTPADWSGIAGYVKYAFSPKVAAAGRYEYFNDHDGFTTGKAQHLNEVTGTLERRIAGHLLSRLEYRHDDSNQNFFQRGGPSFVKGQTTVDAGLVFVLEPSETK
jgi:hypothetical protein